MNPLTVPQVVRRLRHHIRAVRQPRIYFHHGAEVASDPEVVEVRDRIRSHDRDLRRSGPEDHGRSGYQHRRRQSGELKVHLGIHARNERAVGVDGIHFGEQGP